MLVSNFATQAKSKSVTTFKFDVDNTPGSVEIVAEDDTDPDLQGDVLINVNVTFPDGNVTVTKVVLAPTNSPTKAPTNFPTAKPTKLPTPFPTKKANDLSCDTSCGLCEGAVQCGLSKASCTWYATSDVCLDSFIACSKVSCTLCTSEAACDESKAGYDGCKWDTPISIDFDKDRVETLLLMSLDLIVKCAVAIALNLDVLKIAHSAMRRLSEKVCTYKTPPTKQPTKAPTYDKESLALCDAGFCDKCEDVHTCTKMGTVSSVIKELQVVC